MKKHNKVLIYLIVVLSTILLIFLYSNTVNENRLLKKDDNTVALSEQIKNGDFSNLLETGNTDIGEIKRIYEIQKGNDNIEWVQFDINGDDCNELIWQEKNSDKPNMKRIIGIFLLHTDVVECIVWDVNDLTEFLFLSIVGNVIYYTQYYGLYDYIGYEQYKFDNEWNKELVCGLYVYKIYDFLEVGEWWKEEHPYITTTGIYYIRSVVGLDSVKYTEKLGEDQFLEAFMENCGASLYDLEPGWVAK